ncbi:hypothetical protein BB558_002308, partial [Smittium angustum]
FDPESPKSNLVPEAENRVKTLKLVHNTLKFSLKNAQNSYKKFADNTRILGPHNKPLTLIVLDSDIVLNFGNNIDCNIIKHSLELHSLASNAKINCDKTITVKLGCPSFPLNFPLSLNSTNYKYLGIEFNTKGLAIKETQNYLKEKIINSITYIKSRNISIIGKTLIAKFSYFVQTLI